MPLWMANVVVTLNDEIAADDVPWFVGELLERAKRWRVLDDRAWERVSLAYRKACIRQALDYAERLQPTPRPAYWSDVQDVCGAVMRALDGEGSLEAAAKAAGETAWPKIKPARSDDAEMGGALSCSGSVGGRERGRAGNLASSGGRRVGNSGADHGHVVD